VKLINQIGKDGLKVDPISLAKLDELNLCYSRNNSKIGLFIKVHRHINCRAGLQPYLGTAFM
jgi:hypothetical protein